MRLRYTKDALVLKRFVTDCLRIGNREYFDKRKRTLKAGERCELLGDIEVNRDLRYFTRIR